MDVKTTFRNLVRDQSVSICMLQTTSAPVGLHDAKKPNFQQFYLAYYNLNLDFGRLIDWISENQA